MLFPSFEYCFLLYRFTFFQYPFIPSKVYIGRGKVVDCFMIPVIIVIVHECAQSKFKFPGQKVVLQFDDVLHRTVVAFYLSLCLRMVWSTPYMVHFFVPDEFFKVVADVARAIVGQEPWSLFGWQTCLFQGVSHGSLGIFHPYWCRVPNALCNGCNRPVWSIDSTIPNL